MIVNRRMPRWIAVTLAAAGLFSSSQFVVAQQPMTRKIGVASVSVARPAIDPVQVMTDAAAQIELGWLAEPGLFHCQISAKVCADAIELSGFVPNAQLKQKVVQIAKANFEGTITDGLHVQAGMPLDMTRPSPAKDLAESATVFMTSQLGDKILGLQMSCPAPGRIEIGGTVASTADKLEISKCLRGLDGCTHVVNRAAVVPVSPAIVTLVPREAAIPQPEIVKPAPKPVAPIEVPKPIPAPKLASVPKMVPATMPEPSPPQPVVTRGPGGSIILAASPAAASTVNAEVPSVPAGPVLTVSPTALIKAPSASSAMHMAMLKRADDRVEAGPALPTFDGPALPAPSLAMATTPKASEANIPKPTPAIFVVKSEPLAMPPQPAATRPGRITLTPVLEVIPETKPTLAVAPELRLPPTETAPKAPVVLPIELPKQIAVVKAATAPQVDEPKPAPVSPLPVIESPKPVAVVTTPPAQTQVDVPAPKAVVIHPADLPKPAEIVKNVPEPSTGFAERRAVKPSESKPAQRSTKENIAPLPPSEAKEKPAFAKITPMPETEIAPQQVKKPMISQASFSAGATAGTTSNASVPNNLLGVIRVPELANQTVTRDSELICRAVETVCRGENRDLEVRTTGNRQISLSLKVKDASEWSAMQSRLRMLPETAGCSLIYRITVADRADATSTAKATTNAPMMGVIRGRGTGKPAEPDVVRKVIEEVCRDRGEDLTVRPTGSRQVAIAMKVTNSADWDQLYARIRQLPEIADYAVIFNVQVR